MGTAANMNYAAVSSDSDGALTVTAVVTGGVETNAACAGDPAAWRETGAGWEKVPAYAGTINTMLLVNTPLTHAALARAVVTMTEGKSAALQRLAVPSRQSPDLATGTGTDQYCLAAPRQRRPRPDLGQHARQARRADRPDCPHGDAGGTALAERPRTELHARPVSRAVALRPGRGDVHRRHHAAARRASARAVAPQRQGGHLRAAGGRRRARAGHGVRSRAPRHAPRGGAAGRRRADGGDAGRQRRGAPGALARVPGTAARVGRRRQGAGAGRGGPGMDGEVAFGHDARRLVRARAQRRGVAGGDRRRPGAGRSRVRRTSGAG